MAKKTEETQSLPTLIAAIEKKFGKGSIITGGIEFPRVERIPTGSIGLDLALGGGYGRGRIIELFGPESCLAGESFLQYEVWQGDKRLNHKGSSIRRLCERFYNTQTEDEPKQGRHLQINDNVQFYVKSVDDEGRILRNLVLDVVHTGHKPCYQIHTETGQVLRCTLEHKFMTPSGFVPLKDLEVGSEVYVHNNTRVKGRKKLSTRPAILVKYHPHWPTKIVRCTKTGNDYLYYRGQTSRMAYEAHLNDMTLESYREFLNTKSKSKIEQLQFLPDDIHVHHQDEDFTNNKISNLQLIDPSEHGSIHAKDRIKNLSFITTPSKITKIFLVGDMDTYDLRCEYPYNNYIAEGIVVHNSGKTTLATHALAECQKLGRVAAFIDAEHAFDANYAMDLGVDMEKVLLSQPNSGEEALQLTELMVRSGEVGLVVIDSVSALVPKAELEKEIGDHVVGRQATLMSAACRRLCSVAEKSQTTVIFINQIRMKIGVMFGSPETTSGGNALKFFCSQRLDIRRKGVISEGDDKTGIESMVKVIKNKIGPPFKTATFNIMFGSGIDSAVDLLNVAVEKEIIKKAGAWFSYEGEQIGQGTAKASQWLKDNEEIALSIRTRILTP